MLAYDSNRQNACVSSAWWIKIIAWWRTNCRWSVMELSHLLACVNAYTRVRVSLKGWIVRLIQSTLCCYVMLFFGERIVRYSAVSWCKLLNERTMFRCAYLVAYRLSSIRVTHATWSRDKCDNVAISIADGQVMRIKRALTRSAVFEGTRNRWNVFRTVEYRSSDTSFSLISLYRSLSIASLGLVYLDVKKTAPGYESTKKQEMERERRGKERNSSGSVETRRNLVLVLHQSIFGLSFFLFFTPPSVHGIYIFTLSSAGNASRYSTSTTSTSKTARHPES